MTASKSHIKTTVVGSYPIPDWLVALPSEQALEDATRVVLATQQDAGIDVVCDGELYRFDVNHPETNGMIDYFLVPMAGIRAEATFDELHHYRSQPGMGFRARPPAVVEGRIDAGTLDLPGAAARAKRLASRPLKFTLTGPHMLAKTVIDHHYGDVEGLAMALAEVLADQVRHIEAEVVQVDEANIPGNPDEWPWAAKALNLVLDAVSGVPAVHLCFGNYGGQSVQQGSWEKLIEYLDNLHADHIVLESADRPREELAILKALRPDLGVGLGVIDIKSNRVESADEVARAIERAEETLGAGRVTYVNPDCGFWMLRRSVADAKIRALVAGRDRFEGRG